MNFLRPIVPMFAGLLLAAALAGGCRGRKALPPAPKEPPFTARRGKLLYRKWCASCHGERGRGDGLGWGEGRKPRPADLTSLPPREPAALESLWTGKGASRACPSWKENFSPSQVRALAAFLASLRREAEEGRGGKKGRKE